jgi:hypothetical protein
MTLIWNAATPMVLGIILVTTSRTVGSRHGRNPLVTKALARSVGTWKRACATPAASTPMARAKMRVSSFWPMRRQQPDRSDHDNVQNGRTQRRNEKMAARIEHSQ